jgi:tRNA-2-methylthio-N6-dimethylallyladenosine synthase
MSKKLYIQTLGCAMNVRDSEHIIAELSKKEDYALCYDAKEADLLLINTCSVREKPVSKLFSEIGVLKKLKKESAKLGICGCTASHLGQDIIKKAPVVDFVLGARNVSKITQAIHEEKFVDVSISHDESNFEFEEYRTNPFKAYINISIGCDKQCTFCIVPNTRGEEISIPSDIIIKEVQKAVTNGAQEVFLLGQNVNNYGKRFSANEKRVDFVDLLDMISQVDGLKRIRFTSPHPLHMDDRFIAFFLGNEKICKSMHMPLQSGSTEILRQMKRGYTKEWFLDRALKLRDANPNVTISTDIIVGFPGESESDFEDTMDVVEKVQFEQIFSFKYSARPLTKAADFTNQVEESIASQRLQRLQQRQNEILDSIASKQKDRIHSVYFDELKAEGKIAGRSDNNFLVNVIGSEELLGEVRSVRIMDPSRSSLFGALI